MRSVGDDGRELALDSYQTFADTDLLADGIVARMVAGLSTRRYPMRLEPVGSAVEQAATGTSKSSVSRRFVAATAERLAALCARPLGPGPLGGRLPRRLPHGRPLPGRPLGVTADCTKVPLGVVEGFTENAAVCTRLVADLADRGLDAKLGILFVVDGGKALDKAIGAVFGGKAVIQRCRRYKERSL